MVSADQYNRSNVRTTTVAVLTTTQQLSQLPGSVTVPADVTRLPKESIVCVTQIGTIDRSVLGERIGLLPTGSSPMSTVGSASR